MLRTDEIIPLGGGGGGARRKAENINDGNGKLERKEDFNSSSYLRGGSATSILAVCSAGPAQTHQTVLLISCHLSSPWAYVACVSSVCINWHSLCTKHTWTSCKRLFSWPIPYGPYPYSNIITHITIITWIVPHYLPEWCTRTVSSHFHMTEEK